LDFVLIVPLGQIEAVIMLAEGNILFNWFEFGRNLKTISVSF